MSDGREMSPVKLHSTRKGVLLCRGASTLLDRGAAMVLTLPLILVACLLVASSVMGQETREAQLTGTWVYTEGQIVLTLQLNEDGSGSLQGKAFSYTARGNRLVLVEDSGTVSPYTFELKDDVLTLVQGSKYKVEFKRGKSSDAKSQDGGRSARSAGQTGGSGESSPKPFSRRNAAEEEDTGIVGRWQSSDFALEIFNDGKLTINGDPFNYRVEGRHVVLSNDEGSIRVEFQLDRDTLTTNYQGQRTVYRRVRGGSSASGSSNENYGANPPELAGKWCYMSNVTANNGGRMSNTCFTLYPNGTYEYYSETSSSNPYGGTSSQSSDAGTWSVSGSSLIANSRSRGRQVYTLEKRNHPKTGDPMLMVDGDAFVTYTQRRPW